LIQPAVFFGDFHQTIEFFKPVWGIVAFRNPLLVALKPIQHIMLLYPMFRGAAMIGFHKRHHLVILALPSFVLCHIIDFDKKLIEIEL
jgi:hypothetical protein